MDFKEQLELYVKETEDIILSYLPEEKGFQKTVFEAMNYSFQAGGKRLRPLIMYRTYKAYGGNEKIIEPFMSALEMIHTYSLVHDDLPEMDNDELRRGKPTTHVKYGQAMAVLAGDGLLNYAFETALKAGDDIRVLKALRVLANKAGIYGMIGGQTVDVESEKAGSELTKEQILFTYENKTAALLQAALMIGAILAGASDEAVKNLEEVGYNLGVAFQLQDDILDITSTTSVLGKPVGSDEKNGKKTYVSYLGMDQAVTEQKRLSKNASLMLTKLGKDNNLNESEIDFLSNLITYLVDRKL